jgi:hypothetical protein
MVCGFERGCARLRLPQDFGRPEDGVRQGHPAQAVTAAAPPPPGRPAAPPSPTPAPPARHPARLPGRRSKMA